MDAAIAIFWLYLHKGTLVVAAKVMRAKQSEWVETSDTSGSDLVLLEAPELHGKEKTYYVSIMGVSGFVTETGKIMRLEAQVLGPLGDKAVAHRDFQVDARGVHEFDQFVVVFKDVRPDVTFSFMLVGDEDVLGQVTITPEQLTYFHRPSPDSADVSATRTLPVTGDAVPQSSERNVPMSLQRNLILSRISPEFSGKKHSDLLNEAQALVQQYRVELDNKPLDKEGKRLIQSSMKQPIKILKYLIRSAVPGKYSHERLRQHLCALELRAELYLKQVCYIIFVSTFINIQNTTKK